MQRLRGVTQSVPARVVQKFIEDQAPNWAIVIAWNGLFALFPIALVAAALLGLVLQFEGVTSDKIYEALLAAIPDAGTRASLFKILTTVREQTGLLAIIGLVGLIWGGSGLFGAMEQAFSVVYRVRPRDFIRSKLMSIAMVFLFTILAGIAVTTSSLLPALKQIPNIPEFLTSGVAAFLTQFALGVAAGSVLFLIIYYVVPHRKQLLRHVWPGALVAGGLFELVSLIFPLYLAINKGLDAYGKTFGLFFLLMTFFFFVGLITMVGVEVNSVLSPADVAQPAPAAAPKNLAPEAARPVRSPRRGIRARTVLILAVVASGIGLLVGRRSSGKL